MEINVSSPKPGGLSASDYVSDLEEEEASDNDDDDRNHKHRRRDDGSQFLERDSLGEDIARPYRKRDKPFANGQSFRGNDSQASAPSKYFNSSSSENFPGRFDKRRTGSASVPRAPFDLHLRMRANQAFPGDLGAGRGRGQDSASWSQHDLRFSSDISTQLVQQGPLHPSMFGGRGLPNVSNPQSGSWNAFGLLPGVPNGGMDRLHSIGLQGTLRPPIHPLNMGIPRQRCRDFEERGFCLRGDMCPMEHGVNRIVVEDVQSLSQFNLPVSLPSAHVLGKPTVPGHLPSGSASLMNNKRLHGKTGKSTVTDDTSSGGTDLYDPDQPLWNNNGPETSNAILGLRSPRNDETDSLCNDDPSDRQQASFCDNADNESPISTVGTAAGSQSTSVSVWGRIGSSKSRSDMKGKIDPKVNYSDIPENETESLVNIHQQHQGKHSLAEDVNYKPVNSLPKRSYDTMRTVRTVRKPSQKALRTLFVNGIPHKSNRKDALVSHFQKFGEILDIYIPTNSEQAFVQFSKREEAEAALTAPDAVMGNRFIKLWWANRDSILEDGPGKARMVSESSPGLLDVSVPFHSSVSSISKDNQQCSSSKGSIVHVSDASLPSVDNSKPVTSNGPKAPPLQKKLENLEQLKEELRKKQEMLDQKRNDFRRQLYKLEKQGGPKGEADTELTAKRRKVGLAADAGKDATPSSSSPSAVSALADEMLTDKNQSADTLVSHSPKIRTTTAVLQSPNLKHQVIRPSVPLGTPVPMNRYKLDNRPTGFRICPPLPSGFANVTVIKAHFVPFGDVSDVELEDLESHESSSELDISKKCSARVNFATRRAAENAFLNGKCWEGCGLKFVWLTSSNSNNGCEKSPSTTPRGTLSADVWQGDKLASTTSQDASALGDVDSKPSERKVGVEHIKLGEPSEPSSSSTSQVKESSKGDVSSPTSQVEESSKGDAT